MAGGLGPVSNEDPPLDQNGVGEFAREIRYWEDTLVYRKGEKKRGGNLGCNAVEVPSKKKCMVITDANKFQYMLYVLEPMNI